MYAVLYASMNCCATIERLVRGFLMMVPSAAVVRRFGGAAAVRCWRITRRCGGTRSPRSS
eukprot:6971291-Prymnesium_polylepis.1